MKQSSIHSHATVSKEKLSTLVNAKGSPLATHIEVPVNIASHTAELNQRDQFNNTIKALNLSGQSTTPRGEDLYFGAPQLDLSFEKGTLRKNAVHEIHPKHFRDQTTALTAGIALLKHQQGNHPNQTSTPIFCFLLEQESNSLDKRLSTTMTHLNLNSQDMIIITAKHSDDLLWAIEETMHLTNGAQMIAHFNMIPATSVQRLDYIAANTGNTCLLVCNHKSEGTSQATSSWSIQQIERQTPLTFSLEFHQSRTESFINKPVKSVWQVTWVSDQNRFRAAPVKQAKEAPQTMDLAA